jgi:tRNA U55 pseudouridine synthase TruB
VVWKHVSIVTILGYTRIVKRYITLEKNIGETPLALIEAWRKRNPAYKSVSASYAGRLDPMASGKLIVLLGEECRRQEAYTKLDKEYEIEVLLDVGSDTGDILGLCEYAEKETNVSDSVFRSILRKEEGSVVRKYPAFSSKTLRGKPLFLHKLEGTLVDDEIPEHIERLYRAQYLSHAEISSVELVGRIKNLLALVPRTTEPSKALGKDFRIEEVRASWERVFAQAGARTFQVARVRVVCASGAYMRSLAPRIGEALDTKALALSIHRTKIGKYLSLGPLELWLKNY